MRPLCVREAVIGDLPPTSALHLVLPHPVPLQSVMGCLWCCLEADSAAWHRAMACEGGGEHTPGWGLGWSVVERETRREECAQHFRPCSAELQDM